MLWKILLMVIIIWYVKSLWVNRRKLLLSNKLKCDYPALPIVGHAYLFIGSDQDLYSIDHIRMESMKWFGMQALKHGGLTKLWLMSKLYTVVVDPLDVEYITKTCLSKDDVMKSFKSLVGNGIIVAPVPIWRRRRKFLVPTFSQKNLVQFVDVFAEQSDVLVGKLKSSVGETISVFNYIALFSMDAVCETNFGMKMGCQNNPNHPFLTAFQEICTLAAVAMMQPWLRLKAVKKLTSTYQKLRDYTKQIRETVEEIITAKRVEIEKKQNLGQQDDGKFKSFLDLLIQSSSSENGYTDEELLEESLVITMAGTDTSAVSASFALVLLSRHQDIQQKVYDELFEVFGDSKRRIVAEDLPKLKYLDAVMRETMRLYPPAPALVRKVEKEVTLPSGVTLVPDTGVIISVWGIHRNKEYWGEDAEEFRPERFLESPLKHPAQYMTFSHGPRNCAGYGYAMMSMKTALATILRHYKVAPVVYDETVDEMTDLKNDRLRVRFDIMLKHVDKFKIKLLNRF